MRQAPLAILRKHLGISQAELGRQMGVTRQHISSVEKGTWRLDALRLLQLRDTYPQQMRKCGLRLEDLLLAKVGYKLGSQSAAKHTKNAPRGHLCT